MDSRPFRVSHQSVCIDNSSISNLSIPSSILNCKIRSMASPFECLLCDQNFAIQRADSADSNGLFTSCTLKSSINTSTHIILQNSISPILTVSGQKIEKIENYPPSCKIVSFSSRSVNVCAKCISSIQIIKGYSPVSGSKPNIAFTNINTESEENEFFPSYPAIQACTSSYSDFVEKNSGASYLSQISDCLYAQELSGDSGLVCLQCSGGRAAKIFTAQNDKEGLALLTKFGMPFKE